MLKIGEFSKLSRVSIRMLRHYDDIGLLKPAEIDCFTGYRYYSPDQLPIIGRITALKDMGFQLADIVKILEIYENREMLDSYFERRQAEVKAVSVMAEYQMRLLDTARKRLRKEQSMSYNVSIKTIPERYAATVHMTIPRYEDEGLVWQILNEETGSMNMIPADPCLVAAEYLDDEYKETDVELIAWKTVKGEYPDTAHVKFKTLPPVKVASCMVKGGYEQMPDVYGAVISWVNENGYECTGPMFNIYHVSPHETDNPDEFITEVCYAVK